VIGLGELGRRDGPSRPGHEQLALEVLVACRAANREADAADAAKHLVARVEERGQGPGLAVKIVRDGSLLRELDARRKREATAAKPAAEKSSAEDPRRAAARRELIERLERGTPFRVGRGLVLEADRIAGDLRAFREGTTFGVDALVDRVLAAIDKLPKGHPHRADVALAMQDPAVLELVGEQPRRPLGAATPRDALGGGAIEGPRELGAARRDREELERAAIANEARRKARAALDAPAATESGSRKGGVSAIGDALGGLLGGSPP
jgi:hypothetical protein